MSRETDLTPIQVVVGVLADDRDRILIQQRSDGPFAGLWELPGGKMESAETLHDALCRELHEELGVTVTGASALIRITHRYPDRIITLNTFVVDQYHGPVEGREGQPLKWVARKRLFKEPMLPADRPLTMAINLPHGYWFTPDLRPAATIEDENAFVASLEAPLRDGVRLLCLRCPSCPDADYERLAKRAAELCQHNGVRLMLYGSLERAALARRIGAAGLHLDAVSPATALDSSASDGLWLAAHVRGDAQLERAGQLGINFAVLEAGPAWQGDASGEVAPWDTFIRRVESAALPVYVGGRLDGAEVARARAVGCQGVAADGPIGLYSV